MSAPSASGVKRLPLLRSPFRYWLAVVLALIVLVSVLPRAGRRRLWLLPYNSPIRVPREVERERYVARTSGVTVHEGAAVSLPSAQEPESAERRSLIRYLRPGVYWLVVAVASVALVAVLASVGARLLGYSPYVMYGGSMGSAAPLGSVAVMEDVTAESLKVGDVIVFRPPSSGEARDPLMHRIVSIEEVDGQRAVRTKGDANQSPDPWKLTISGEGGKLAYVVPYVGHLFWFFQTRVAWVVAVLPMAAYLGLVALRRIWAPTGCRGTSGITAS